jgi:hypothetical protein
MFAAALGIRTEMLNAGRLPALSRPDSRMTALELAVLVLSGVAAAAMTVLMPMKIGVPGHAILKGALPLVFGLALVPRRNSALIMGAVAGITGGLFVSLDSFKLPIGALTSLCLFGPFLELALIRPAQGWKLYLRLTLAGLFANLVAYAIHFGLPLLGFAQTGGRGQLRSWQVALASFIVCGAAAGLLSAIVWFRATRRETSPELQESPSS